MWAALVAVLAAATVLLFEPFRQWPGLRAAIADLPAPLVSFLGIAHLGRWSGFVDAILFGLVAPIAFLSLGIGVGTRSGLAHHANSAPPWRPLAGLSGSVRAQPRSILPSVAAVATGTVLLGIATFAAVLVAAAGAHQPVAPVALVTAAVAQMTLGITFGVIGLMVAMLTGRVGLAALVATIAALAADTMNGVAPAIPALRALRYGSLVYYAEAGSPISRGVPVSHLAVLFAAVAAAIAGTAAAVNVDTRRRRVRQAIRDA